MGQLDGKTALITGSARGIGKAIATTFANEGARVVVHDIHEDEGTALAKELGGAFLKANLTSMDETRSLAQRTLETTGGVDLLVNNAGFQIVAPVEDFDETTWANMVQVMLIAPFQLTKWLLPAMKTRGWGRIINMSSIHGLVASPYKSAYVSAKHGLLGFTKTIALEAAPFGVTVNAICPAYVRTGLVEAQIASQAKTLGIPEAEVVDKVMLEPAAIKHLVEPGEVAELALFLASDAARSITGSAYELDLGWTAH